jgi:hypothetical protein
MSELTQKTKTILATTLTVSVVLLTVTFICWLSQHPIDRAVGAYQPLRAAEFVDEGDVAHLAYTHPDLTEMCGMAGSCDAVYCQFWKDGNDGKPLWNCLIPGVRDEGGPLNTVGAGTTLDEAAAAFVNTVRFKRAKTAYKGQP